MSRLVKYDAGNGATVLFEVSDEDVPEELLVSTKSHEVIHRAAQELGDALDGLKPVLEAVFEKLKVISPSELQIELGIKATAEAGIVISKLGGEANIKVTATWKDGGKAK